MTTAVASGGRYPCDSLSWSVSMHYWVGYPSRFESCLATACKEER